MPAYSVDPVIPKPGKRRGVGSKGVSNSGNKKGMASKKGSTSGTQKTRFAGSTSNNEPYISPKVTYYHLYPVHLYNKANILVNLCCVCCYATGT